MQPSTKAIVAGIGDIFFYTKLRDALRPAGYELQRAKTAEELIERVRSGQARAVVLNLNDDQLGGLQALDQLTNTQGPSRVPILAFANHDDVHTWNRARELGVTKIVSRNEFSRRTRELIEEILADQPELRQ